MSIFLEISVNLDEIQYVSTTYWFVEASAKFIFVQVMFKGGNSAVILCNICLTSSCVGALVNRFVSNLV